VVCAVFARFVGDGGIWRGALGAGEELATEASAPAIAQEDHKHGARNRESLSECDLYRRVRGREGPSCRRKSLDRHRNIFCGFGGCFGARPARPAPPGPPSAPAAPPRPIDATDLETYAGFKYFFFCTCLRVGGRGGTEHPASLAQTTGNDPLPTAPARTKKQM